MIENNFLLKNSLFHRKELNIVKGIYKKRRAEVAFYNLANLFVVHWKWNFPTHTNTIRFAESIHGIITRVLSHLSWRDKEHEPFYQADRVPRWCKASDTCMDIDTSW